MNTQDLVDAVFSGPSVELPQMLDAREQRAQAIAEASRKAGENGAVVSVTLGIPGPVKTSEVLRRLFRYFYDEVTAVLADYKVQVSRLVEDAATGPEVQFVVLADAKMVKSLLVPIEEKNSIGRLADLDVLSGGDNPVGISRTELGMPERRCLICGKPSKECGRARAHSVVEMQQTIAQILGSEGLV